MALQIRVSAQQAMAALASIQGRFNQLSRAIGQLDRQIQRVMLPASDKFRRIWDDALKGTTKLFKSWSQSIGRSITDALSISSIVSIFRSAMSTAVQGAMSFGDSVLSINAKFVSFMASMTSLRGSAEKANEDFRFLVSTTMAMGSNLEGSIIQYHRLAAAMRNVDESGELTRQTFLGISAAAGALQLDSQTMGNSIKAIVDIASKGKLSLEEVQKQLGNSIPGAVSTMAKSLMDTPRYVEAGIKTVADAEKKLREDIFKGTSNAYEAIYKFTLELQRTYGDAAEAVADSFIGQGQRLKTAQSLLMLQFGKTTALDGLGKIFESLRLKVEKLSRVIEPIGNLIGDAFYAIAEAINNISDDTLVELSLAGATFVDILATGIKSLLEKFGEFDSSGSGLSEKMIDIAKSVSTAFNIVYKAGELIKGVFNTLTAIFSAFLTAILKIASAITGLMSKVVLIPGVRGQLAEFSEFLDGVSQSTWDVAKTRGNQAVESFKNVFNESFFDEMNAGLDNVASRVAGMRNTFQENIANDVKKSLYDPVTLFNGKMNANQKALLAWINKNSSAPNDSSEKEAAKLEAKTTSSYEKAMKKSSPLTQARAAQDSDITAIDDYYNMRRNNLEKQYDKEPMTLVKYAERSSALDALEAQKNEDIGLIRNKHADKINPLIPVTRQQQETLSGLKNVGRAQLVQQNIQAEKSRFDINDQRIVTPAFEAQIREFTLRAEDLKIAQNAVNDALQKTVEADLADSIEFESTMDLINKGYTDAYGKLQQLTDSQKDTLVLDILKDTDIQKTEIGVNKTIELAEKLKDRINAMHLQSPSQLSKDIAEKLISDQDIKIFQAKVDQIANTKLPEQIQKQLIVQSVVGEEAYRGTEEGRQITEAKQLDRKAKLDALRNDETMPLSQEVYDNAVLSDNRKASIDQLNEKSTVNLNNEQFSARTAVSMIGEDDMVGTDAYYKEKLTKEQEFQAKLDALKEEGHLSEKDRKRAELNQTLNSYANQSKAASSFFGDMATASQAFGEKGFKAYKAFAMAQATADAIGASIAAFKSGSAFTPIVGAAMAAAALAAGMAKVAQIRAMQPAGYKSGGYTGDAPLDQEVGVVHGKEFVVNAAATKQYRPMLEALNAGEKLDNVIPFRVPTKAKPELSDSSQVAAIIEHSKPTANTLEQPGGASDSSKAAKIIQFQQPESKSIKKVQAIQTNPAEKTIIESVVKPEKIPVVDPTLENFLLAKMNRPNKSLTFNADQLVKDASAATGTDYSLVMNGSSNMAKSSSASALSPSGPVAPTPSVGFKKGGYTGDVPVDEVAGAVHGREFVMNAEATKIYRPFLELLNSGEDIDSVEPISDKTPRTSRVTRNYKSKTGSKAESRTTTTNNQYNEMPELKPELNVTNIIVQDTAQLTTYMNSVEGTNAIINVVSKHRDVLGIK